MKKQITSLFFLLLISVSVTSQDLNSLFLWPIKGEKAGTNIIYSPQSYIDDELVNDKLIISAPEGTSVLAPADGVIKGVYTSFYINLKNVNSSKIQTSFDKGIADAEESFKGDIKYLNGEITIELKDGSSIGISGMRGDIQFKTGQRINKGDVLGTVGYFYQKIERPAISLSISSKQGVDLDPMTPFGLKTTFIPQVKEQPVLSLTKEQAKADFMISINALKEAFVGLNDVISEKELDDYVNESLNKINAFESDLNISEFQRILKTVVSTIHDSHIGLINPSWYRTNNSKHRPEIWIGWINDKLICTNSTPKYKDLIGKEILSVNGIKAEDAKKMLSQNIGLYDAKATGYIDINLATFSFRNLFTKDIGEYNYDMFLEMADGQKIEVKSEIMSKNMPSYLYDFGKFMTINKHKDSYKTAILNDSTAYLGLSSFTLNQIQLENISLFISSILNKKHLIIDVRNNGGGTSESINKIFSLIALKPSESNGYQYVNKKGQYECFKYSQGFFGVDNDIFPEYKEGADGRYYSHREVANDVKPDPLINYKGKVYVLTNEFSVSAATLFPALVVRNGRGVIVGRETSTAYHFMNAEKFVSVQLPNSKFVVKIPLVKLVFDDIVNERVPYGRGVLPDYYIPITLDELISKDGDMILNQTLKLIEKEKYL